MNTLARSCLRAALVAALFACFPVARAAAASTPDNNTPVAVEAVIPVPSTLNLTQVKSAVLEALALRKWVAQDAGDGKISATYTRGNMTLSLAITYGAKEVKVSVAQWDSRPRVQKTQERWFANAKKDIADELVKLAVLSK